MLSRPWTPSPGLCRGSHRQLLTVPPASGPRVSGGAWGSQGASCPSRTPCPALLSATLLSPAGLPPAALDGSLQMPDILVSRGSPHPLAEAAFRPTGPSGPGGAPSTIPGQATRSPGGFRAGVSSRSVATRGGCGDSVSCSASGERRRLGRAGQLAMAADGFQPLLPEISSAGPWRPLSSWNLLALGFLALLLAFPSDSLGKSVGGLPRLWPPPFFVCLERASSLSSWSCFLGSAGLTPTPCLTVSGGCGSQRGGQPGAPRRLSPRLSPLDIPGPRASSGATEPRAGLGLPAWLGSPTRRLGLSFPGTLRLFFPGGWHVWGAGGAAGLGWEAVALCSPCFLALWRLRPGPERKEAEQTSQVTGCPLGAPPLQWPFSVNTGFFLKPRGFCLGSWGLRGSPWGLRWRVSPRLWGDRGLESLAVPLGVVVLPGWSSVAGQVTLRPLVPASDASVTAGRPAPGISRPSCSWRLASASPSWQVWGSGPMAPRVEGSVGTAVTPWLSLLPGGSEEGPLGTPSGWVLDRAPLGSGHSALGPLTAPRPPVVGMPDRAAAVMVTLGEVALAGGGGVTQAGASLGLSFLEPSRVLATRPPGQSPPWAGVKTPTKLGSSGGPSRGPQSPRRGW